MNSLTIEKRKVDVNALRKTHAQDGHVSAIIDQPTFVTDEQGSPLLLYTQIDWADTSHLVKAVRKIKFQTTVRTPEKAKIGLVTRSMIFGYKPRLTIRRDFCNASAMSRDYPDSHLALTEFAKELNHVYQMYFPREYAAHQQTIADKVKPDWVMEGSVFTSGIVNYNNPLPYHTDKGNFPGLLSNMVALRKGISGGNLIVPELDLGFKVTDSSLIIFNGQELIHGVSPILTLKAGDSYRYTIVYYSLQQMWKCDTIANEVARLANLKTDKARKRTTKAKEVEQEKK